MTFSSDSSLILSRHIFFWTIHSWMALRLLLHKMDLTACGRQNWMDLDTYTESSYNVVNVRNSDEHSKYKTNAHIQWQCWRVFCICCRRQSQESGKGTANKYYLTLKWTPLHCTALHITYNAKVSHIHNTQISYGFSNQIGINDHIKITSYVLKVFPLFPFNSFVCLAF